MTRSKCTDAWREPHKAIEDTILLDRCLIRSMSTAPKTALMPRASFIMGKCLDVLHRNPVLVLAFVLKRLLLALDYLHRECQVIHTGMYSGPLFLQLQLLLCAYLSTFYQISKPITSCSASRVIPSLAI